MTRYYLGDYEEEVTPDGNIRKIHYISGGDGLAAILIRNHGNDTLYYSYTDQLGSLTALTDESGNVVERYAYDPWGKRRNPENWTQSDSRSGHIVNRGYTMHEHLDAFSIINMNGRVYDPLTAQFFSPDPYIANSDNWLCYNRYAYCLNNPFKFSDPSGEIPILIPIIAGLIGGGSNLYSNWDKVDNFWDVLGYFASGAAGGAISTLPGGQLIGGTITSVGNVVTDVVGGDIPDIQNTGDVVRYFGGAALDGFTVAGVGSITKSVYNAVTNLYQRVWMEGSAKIVSRSVGSFAVSGPEVIVEAGKNELGAAIGKTAAAKGGITVLGHYPEYVKLAESVGARQFQIPTSVWEKMSAAEKWTANTKFLDRMVLRGDNIRLATPLNQVKPGSFFQKELNYLFDKGYKLSSNGLWLIK